MIVELKTIEKDPEYINNASLLFDYIQSTGGVVSMETCLCVSKWFDKKIKRAVNKQRLETAQRIKEILDGGK